TTIVAIIRVGVEWEAPSSRTSTNQMQIRDEIAHNCHEGLFRARISQAYSRVLSFAYSNRKVFTCRTTLIYNNICVIQPASGEWSVQSNSDSMFIKICAYLVSQIPFEIAAPFHVGVINKSIHIFR